MATEQEYNDKNERYSWPINICDLPTPLKSMGAIALINAR